MDKSPAKCKACGAQVDQSKPEGWNGEHRYGCLGPSTWIGFLEGWSHPHRCFCGEQAILRIRRGYYDLYACSAKHARSQKSNATKTENPFSIFARACYQ